MKTLIELYDERPIENVISTEMFRPEMTVFLCSNEIAESKQSKKTIENYLRHRGVKSRLVFVSTSLLDASAVAKTLKNVLSSYEDCALDISGGSDAALFAAGLVCAQSDTPVFTYSRKKNAFFNIQHAPFAQDLPCELHFGVEDSFLMAGGAVRMGRVDNAILGRYAALIGPFFHLFLRYRRQWNRLISYVQAVSKPDKSGKISLSAGGAFTVKGGNGRKVSAPEGILKDLLEIGMIADLSIHPSEGVHFRFADAQVRAWLRDVGSVLELYAYQSCLETKSFSDVRTSVIVDWESGEPKGSAVSNEIDVIACRGITPLFISCKVCGVKTEALNELAILRDRFGSQIARAAIVTAEHGGRAMRRRAQELDIQVFDLDDLKRGSIGERLKTMLP